MTEPHMQTGVYRLLSQPEIDVLGERVFCDDELGLSWKTVTAMPGELSLSRLNARNEGVLRSIAMLEERDETQQDDAERAELHRLEGKLNLVLELLTELVRSREDAVATHEVRLNTRGICWHTSEPVEGRALLELQLYAMPAWPVPLNLHARVTSCEEQADGRWRVCARLEGLSQGSRDWLGKLVFRRHRRTVAQRRMQR